MTIEIDIIPMLHTNYGYMLHHQETGETWMIDPSEAAPVQQRLTQRGWQLRGIINTHHHYDHVDGNLALKEANGCAIYGFAAEHRIPGKDEGLEDGQRITIAGYPVEVMHVPGHTRGAIALYWPEQGWVFTGDALFQMGCGKWFEGSARHYAASFRRLMALPPETLVYSGHEYAVGNAEFALKVEPDNPLLQVRYRKVCRQREENIPVQGTSLQEELDTNPFLRPGEAAIRQRLAMAQGVDDSEVLARLRWWKDAGRLP